MAFYDIDLTTRTGARGAAHQGGLACFVFAGLAVVGVVVFGGAAGYSTPEGIAAMAGAGTEVVIGLIAGMRLRAGKGMYWGSFVAVLLALEIAMKAVNLAFGGLIISGIILVILINGIRGAWALKRQVAFEDDDAEVFY